MNLNNLQLTRADIEVIKMLLYKEAINKKDASGRWPIERDIFNKLEPITHEILK